MPRYRPGEHVFCHFFRYDLIRLQLRLGSDGPPEFEVMRVLPAGNDGEHSYQVRCSAKAYSRVVKEHELAPVA